MSEKIRATVWLRPSTITRMNRLSKEQGMGKSEFMETAIGFYISYLESSDPARFLPKELRTVVSSLLSSREKTINTLLGRWAVELNTLCHTVARYFGTAGQDLLRVRARCAEETKRANGQIDYPPPEAGWDD